MSLDRYTVAGTPQHLLTDRNTFRPIQASIAPHCIGTISALYIGNPNTRGDTMTLQYVARKLAEKYGPNAAEIAWARSDRNVMRGRYATFWATVAKQLSR